MSEEKTGMGPLQLWNSAVKAVKGETTGQLVEQFTSEMTLVAEGLCEDQARLRRGLDDVRRQQESLRQHIAGEQQVIDAALREQQREIDRRLDELTRRISALETAQRKPAKAWQQGHVLNQLTVLVSIACGTWVLVTILNLFR